MIRSVLIFITGISVTGLVFALGTWDVHVKNQTKDAYTVQIDTQYYISGAWNTNDNSTTFVVPAKTPEKKVNLGVRDQGYGGPYERCFYKATFFPPNSPGFVVPNPPQKNSCSPWSFTIEPSGRVTVQ